MRQVKATQDTAKWYLGAGFQKRRFGVMKCPVIVFLAQWQVLGCVPLKLHIIWEYPGCIVQEHGIQKLDTWVSDKASIPRGTSKGQGMEINRVSLKCQIHPNSSDFHVDARHLLPVSVPLSV